MNNRLMKPLSIVTVGALSDGGKLGERRQCDDEFNKQLSNLTILINRIGSNKNVDETAIREFLSYIQRLLTNEYFRFMYITNSLVREFILASLNTIVELSYDTNLKIEMFDSIASLAEWHIDLETIEFRCDDDTIKRYRRLFEKILPDVVSLMRLMSNVSSSAKHDRPMSSASSSLLMIVTPPNGGQEFIVKYWKGSFKALVRVLCYMLVCVPYETMFAESTLNEYFELMSIVNTQKVNSQLALSLAVNICHYGHGLGPDLLAKSLIESINQSLEEKIKIFMNVCDMTTKLLERFVRNGTYRGMVKRALNIYCECISKRVCASNSSLSIPNAQQQQQHQQKEESFNNFEVDEVSWPNCLYKVVISIVRILRLDFENHENPVEIELVIYFYELLKDNIESLTFEDAFNIAVKLMDILVKIHEWSESSKKTFDSSQYVHLKSLSFELANKFLETLKEKYAESHWHKLEKFWVDGILDWEPNSYRMISTFCWHTARDKAYLIYAHRLGQAILNSWKITTSCGNGGGSLYQCKSSRSPSWQPKSAQSFFKSDMLDAIIDLTLFYDGCDIGDEENTRVFVDDLVALYQLLIYLFRSIQCITVDSGIGLLFKTYARLFSSLSSSQSQHQSHSSLLRNASFWSTHVELIISKLYDMKNRCVSVDDTLKKLCLDLIDSLYGLFNQLMSQYDVVMKHILAYLNNSSYDDQLLFPCIHF